MILSLCGNDPVTNQIVVDETGTVNNVEAIRVGVDGEGVLVGAAQYVAAEGIFVVGKT